MTLADAIDTVDLVVLMLGVAAHANRVFFKRTRGAGRIGPRQYRRTSPAAIPETPYRLGRFKLWESSTCGTLSIARQLSGETAMLIWRDDTLDVIEPTPIDDTFITHLWQVEEAPGACLRGYFCSEEAGLYNLKTKFLIPVTCAAQMNMQAAGAITELMRKHPNFIGRKLLPMLLMVLL